MSSGVVHHQIWRRGWLLTLPLSASLYGMVDMLRPAWNCVQIHCVSGNTFYAMGSLIGYGLGRYLDGDLDQASITSSEGRMINEIPIVGHFLYGYWTIYGSIFRRKHRSFWTHFPGVSTAIRLIYQFWPIAVMIYLKDWNFPWIYQVFMGIFVGLSFADALHWFEDIRSREIRISRKGRIIRTR